MATDSRSQLKSQINVIRTETEEEANTRGRVAAVLDKLVDSSYNKKDDELDTLPTNLSPDFHLGNVIDDDPKAAIVYPKSAKDIVINTGGSQVLYPSRMGNLVLTTESDIRGVGYAYEGNEFSITNRSGKIAPVRDNHSGAPANTKFDLGGSDLMMENNKTYYFKGNGTHWALRANPSRLAFSDAFNSVNAEIGVGLDGMTLIDKVLDRHTDERITLKQVTTYFDGSAMDDTKVDGFVYRKIGSEYFILSNFLSTRRVPAKRLGVTTGNPASVNRANLSAGIRLCAKLKATLEITETFEIDDEIYMTGADSGVSIKGWGMAAIKRSNTSSTTSTRGGIFFIAPTVEDGVPKDIDIKSLILDGNKAGIDKSSGSGIIVYDSGSMINSPQNISISGVRVRNMKSNGINILGKGVIVSDCFVHDNDFHGISTNPGSDKVTYSNILTYNNTGGYGLDVSGGECIATNIWSFNNGQGGMKLSSSTGKFIGDNLVLENNTGPGFQQTGSSPDAIIQIGSILCKDNTNFGLSLTDGRVRSIQSAVCINNNTAGIATYDNRFSDAKIGYLYVEQPESISGNALYCSGTTQIDRIHYKNCDGVLNTANNAFVGIYSGTVENTKGYFIYRTGNANVTFDLHNIKFIDTTPDGSQSTAIIIVNDNKGSIVNCDFTENPGTKVGIHQTSDVLVKDCRGFSHSAEISTTNYTFLKGDRHRYLKFTGSSGNNTVPPDTFEAGDEIRGEVQANGKTIVAGAGVTLRGANLSVSSGNMFVIRFDSPNNALVVSTDAKIVKASVITSNFNLNTAPTDSFYLYNTNAADFIGSPNDSDDWFINRVVGASHTVAIEIAISRTTGQMYSRYYSTGAWGVWVSGFSLDANGNLIIDNTKKVGNGTANSNNFIQFGNGATIYNVPTGQQHIFRQNGSTVAGIDGNGKIYVEGAGKGIILKSPDGTPYEITVPNGGGSLSVTAL